MGCLIVFIDTFIFCIFYQLYLQIFRLSGLICWCDVQALDWLKSYYWDPQTIAIPSNQTVNVKKEIKSLLRELLLSCNVKQSPGSNSTMDKEKRAYTLLIMHLLYVIIYVCVCVCVCIIVYIHTVIL